MSEELFNRNGTIQGALNVANQISSHKKSNPVKQSGNSYGLLGFLVNLVKSIAS